MSGRAVCIPAIAEIRAALEEARARGGQLGIVPTMGALHEGHLSLVRAARAQNEIVVVSVFVNPTQFGPTEDLASYPRDLRSDLKLAGEAGADMIFNPSEGDMFTQGHATWVEVEGLTTGMCGRSRPGHFRGVCTVVAKLFAICRPDRAYFGEKDAQQLAVIKRMVTDLNMGIQIVACPTVREADGLAMSSRNVLLTPEQRTQAPILYRALSAAQAAINAGENDAAALRSLVRGVLTGASLAEIDYVEIVEAEALQPVATVAGECLIAVAVRFGDVRLIDNLRVRA